MNFSERISEALDYAKKRGKTQAKIAEEIRAMPGGENFKQANLSALKVRRNSEGSTYTAHIAKACGVNPFWLATGIGEMLDFRYGEIIGEDNVTVPNMIRESGTVYGTEKIDVECMEQALEALEYLEKKYTRMEDTRKRAEILIELYEINKENMDAGNPPIAPSNVVRLAKAFG